MKLTHREAIRGVSVCISENHSLNEWFKRAYGDEKKSLLRL